MRFVEHIGILRERFDEVTEGYRNPAIWQQSFASAGEIPGHLED
jgi:hypothetical protein